MPKRNRMKLKDFKNYKRIKGSCFRLEDGSRWSTNPQKVKEMMVSFRPYKSEIDLAEVQKCQIQMRKKHKKKYTRYWLEMNHVEVDEFGHTELELQMWAERDETVEEIEVRIYSYLHRRYMEYRDEKLKGDYWNEKEGQKELAFLLLFREREGMK